MAVKIKKNILTVSLMASSMLLLILLQFFWINREYKNAEQTFRKESNLVFQNTIHSLMESYFQTRIQLDSVEQPETSVDLHRLRRNLIKHKVSRHTHTDETPNIMLGFRGNMRDIKAAANASGQMNPVYATHLVRLPALLDSTLAAQATRQFIIRFDPDSLNIDSLSEKLSTGLKKINRNLKFEIIQKLSEEDVGQDTTAYMTEFIKITPRYQYAASFQGVNIMLMKEIVPQILFSVFLSLLTMGAFFVLYKNLLAQQNLVRQKNEFISNVTHELKTPVTTVSVALEALQNFHALENPRRTKEYLDVAQNELKRLSLMTDKILNISAFNHIDVESEQVDLQHLLLQVMDSMKLVWEKQKAIVHTKIEGDNFMLIGNKIHLSNVIYNLLDNAIKYSNAPAKIQIFLRDEGKQLVLNIKDQGIGIPEEYKKKVFEKFFRVPQGNVHNVKGYGLGLSYVARVIKAHNGQIWVKSEVGKGSSFSIKLLKYGNH